MVLHHDLVMVSGINLDQVLVNWPSWLLVDQLGPNGLPIGQYQILIAISLSLRSLLFDHISSRPERGTRKICEKGDKC